MDDPRARDLQTLILRTIRDAIKELTVWIYNELRFGVQSYRALFSKSRQTWKSQPGAPTQKAVKVIGAHVTYGANIKYCVTSTAWNGNRDGSRKVFPTMELCYAVPWVTIVLWTILMSYILPLVRRLLWRALRRPLKRAARHLMNFFRSFFRLLWYPIPLIVHYLRSAHRRAALIEQRGDGDDSDDDAGDEQAKIEPANATNGGPVVSGVKKEEAATRRSPRKKK